MFYPSSNDLRYWATTANANIHIIARDKDGKLVGHVSVTNLARKEIIDVLIQLNNENWKSLGFKPERYDANIFPNNSFSEINKLARWHSKEKNYSGLGKILYRKAVQHCRNVLKRMLLLRPLDKQMTLSCDQLFNCIFQKGLNT